MAVVATKIAGRGWVVAVAYEFNTTTYVRKPRMPRGGVALQPGSVTQRSEEVLR